MTLALPRRWLASVATVALVAAGFVLTTPAGPAQAAVPDVFAFVLWNGAVVGSGTTPSSTIVTPGSAGQYKITFPGKAGKGVAHVTAINSVPHWCQLASFNPAGPDEVLVVNCYRVGGVPDNTAFSAIFDSSTGPISGPGAFGYVNALPSGGLVSQYNSSGATNVVTPGLTGQWTVNLPGLATPTGVYGSLQATAVSPQVPARCKVTSWTSGTGQSVQVACYTSSGSPFNTQFTLSYQYQRSLYGGALPPKFFAYLWTGGAAGASPTSYNSNGGLNTYTTGPITPVGFPLMGAAPDDVQVTATGPSPDFCGLATSWTPSTNARVNCFTPGGTPVADPFLISYNSAV
ncbi:MAG: hypothetical protein ACR2N4_11535 [Jatrophihabitans sp.]